MGMLDRLLGRAAPAATTATAPTIPTPVPWLDDRSAAGLNAIWACVTFIADAVADMPWTEWRGDEQLAPSRLVRRPLVTMPRREWVWRVVATMALENVAYLLHTGGTDSEGAPWSLLPIPPAAIYPIGFVDPYGILPPDLYTIGPSLQVSSSQLTILRRRPWPGIPDALSGLVQLARGQLSSYLAADVAARRYWAAGGPTTTIITSEQEIDDTQAEQIARRWVARRTLGADYPAVMGKGADAKPWGADPTSESAVEARREMVADVGRYFGVPTRMLNAPAGDSETYSNVEQDAVDFERYTLRGYMGPIEDAVSENLPGDALTGRRMRLDSSRFTQGDLASRAAAYSQLVGAGIMTAPEARVRGFALAPSPATELLPTPAPDIQTVSSPVVG